MIQQYHRVALFVPLAVTAVAALFGQSQTQMTTINGKDHPELIDDSIAYSHFFHLLSRTKGEPDELFTRRRLAFAKRTGLGTSQIPLLFAAADKFAEQMKLFEAQPPATQRTQESRDALTQMIMGIVTGLQEQLGLRNASLLTAHVNSVIKRSIVAYVPKQ